MTVEDVLQELMAMHYESTHSHNYYLHAVRRIREKINTSQQPVQNSLESIHDPAEIRRVFEIDAADYPPPDSGFARLGGL